MILLSQAGRFFGWPANHGSWQRGNEMLFGFIEAEYDASFPRKFHNVSGPLTKKLARSLDGGHSWTIETPNVDFNGQFPSPDPIEMNEGDIARFCGVYDHGGEGAWPGGSVYLSRDFGRTWEEERLITGYGVTQLCSTRTCMIGNHAFLSYRGETQSILHDYVVVAELVEGRFVHKSAFGGDDGRCVMPSAVQHNNTIYVACRRRRGNDCWIDLFSSQDFIHWHHVSAVGSTGGNNGNPPALAIVDDLLVCAYGVRDSRQPRMILAVSDDLGQTWAKSHAWECPSADLGYPVIFVREDKSVLVIYYQDEGDRASLQFQQAWVQGPQQSIRTSVVL